MKNTIEKKYILSVIKKPKITEKAGIKSDTQNVYTFEVIKNATKKTISEAIELIYKIKPIKINIVNLPAKKITSRGKRGTQSAIKKALVFLKKGDKIAFI
ncbi:MAG: 50S ribosomal protein L23 [bacterium]